MVVHKLSRAVIAGLLVVAPVLVACEKEDLKDVKQGAKNVEKTLDKTEDKIDQNVGDNDKGKD